MKKQVLFLFFSLMMISVSAQKMGSDGFTVSISNQKSEKYSVDMMGSTHHITEHTGNYLIEKGGKEMAAQKFTLMLMENVTTLNIQSSDSTGNTLTYDPKTKMFEFAGEETKAKNTKNTDNLILSGLLVYAAYLDKNQ